MSAVLRMRPAASRKGWRESWSTQPLHLHSLHARQQTCTAWRGLKGNGLKEATTDLLARVPRSLQQ